MKLSCISRANLADRKGSRTRQFLRWSNCLWSAWGDRRNLERNKMSFKARKVKLKPFTSIASIARKFPARAILIVRDFNILCCESLPAHSVVEDWQSELLLDGAHFGVKGSPESDNVSWITCAQCGNFGRRKANRSHNTWKVETLKSNQKLFTLIILLVYWTARFNLTSPMSCRLLIARWLKLSCGVISSISLIRIGFPQFLPTQFLFKLKSWSPSLMFSLRIENVLKVNQSLSIPTFPPTSNLQLEIFYIGLTMNRPVE